MGWSSWDGESGERGTWFGPAPTLNKHTLRAQKLDKKADKADRKGNGIRSGWYRGKADRAAEKGGWSRWGL